MSSCSSSFPFLLCARRGLAPRWVAALGFPKTLRVAAVRTPDGALPLLRSDEDSGTADPSPTPQRSLAGLLVRLSGEPHSACLLFSEVVCGTMTRPSSPARRPSAGEMPGR